MTGMMNSRKGGKDASPSVVVVIGSAPSKSEYTLSIKSESAQKGSKGGRGVKEKKHGSANDAAKDSDYVTKSINVVSSEDTTKDTIVVSSVGDEPVLSSLGGHTDEKVIDSKNNKGTREGNVGQTPINTSDLHTTDLNNSSPSLSGPTLYAKLVTGEPSRKSVNFCTLLAPTGNGADVAILLESIRSISKCFANIVYAFFLGKRVVYPFNSKYGMDVMLENGPWSNYVRAMIKLQADPKLKDTIVVAIPKLVSEGFYICTIRVKYEWKPPSCSSCKGLGHVLDECSKNIGSNVAKNLKNPRKAARGVPVGPKVGCKQVKQVFRPVLNKTNANTSGKKKKYVKSRKQVSNSNTFDLLNSSHHLFFHVASSSTITTPIFEIIDKLERQIIDRKLTLVDDNVNLLPKVVSMANVDIDSEVEDMVNEHAGFMASTGLKIGNDSGYGDVFTVSKLEEFLMNVIMAQLGDTMVLPPQERKYLMLVSIGQQFSRKLLYSFKNVMLANALAEAEALPTNDARVVINFLKNLFSRFGIPKALISDKAYKTPIGTTPYRLLYGKTCHLPFENEHRAYWALRSCNPDLKITGEKRFLQLHELDELRLQAYENFKLFKVRTKAYHDKKLRIQKEFKAGDKVLL
ncbi:hypothetical protein Tco_1015145 [Tanacetum coccineum]|uniref:DUF4283 domain-containing protein n=1 Tax=Tanacetum coccineum TaxID=301880 RepID=A0ABQ5FJY4_9ASTR